MHPHDSPSWYRTVRMFGGMPWVPLSIAQSLQEQAARLRDRLQWADDTLESTRRNLQAAYREVEHLHGGRPRRARGHAPTGDLQSALDEARRQVDQAMGEARSARAEADRATREARDLARRCEDESSQDEALERKARQMAEDLANVRRHQQAEHERARRAERIVRLEGLGEILDGLIRSVDTHPDPDNPWYQGNRALLQQVRAELHRAGAREIGAVGERFDPRTHEALSTVVTTEVPPDTVVEVHQVGIQLEDGHLVRPARVVVATSNEPRREPPPASEEPPGTASPLAGEPSPSHEPSSTGAPEEPASESRPGGLFTDVTERRRPHRQGGRSIPIRVLDEE